MAVSFIKLKQLVHGAATRGGSMNRKSLRNADDFLGWAVPLLLAVVIDRGMAQEKTG